MKPNTKHCIGIALFAASLAVAEESPHITPLHPKLGAKPFKIDLLDGPFKMTYSRKGLQLSSPKGAFTSRVRWRLQPRFFSPYNDDPRKIDHFFAPADDKLAMSRARFKVDGTTFGGFLDYNYEQDLVGGKMINLFTDANFKPWFSVRFGQWKSIYSQERYISSGSQQFVDRSIINRQFTVDRQAGIALNGRVGEGKRWDSGYSFEILNGTGINSGFRGLSSPMLMARYQWNMFGVEPSEEGSDVKMSKKPAAFLAIAGVKHTSAFTRFSSSGGGQLDGFAASTDPGRYRLTQANGETMFKYRGISVQTETHWKQVFDKTLTRTTVMRGGYYQGGYMLHAAMKWVPKGLEVGYRHAWVDPNQDVARDTRKEHTVVVNFFAEGHSDKWSVDISHLSLQQNGGPTLAEWRHRVQYDVHF